MGKLFDEYKKQIIKYPKELAYKPNHEKYDSNKLHDLFKKICKNQNNNKEDLKAICDFIKISDCIYNQQNQTSEDTKTTSNISPRTKQNERGVQKKTRANKNHRFVSS